MPPTEGRDVPPPAYIATVTIPFPSALRLTLLKQRSEPFDGSGWLFGPKWDGWRALPPRVRPAAAPRPRHVLRVARGAEAAPG